MTQPQRVTRQSKQSGGTFLGVVLGLIVGLVVAALVAFYVTRAPSPFVAKNAAPPQPASASAASAAQFDPNRMLLGHGAASQPAATVLNGEPQIVEVPAANGGGSNAAQGTTGTGNNGAASAVVASEKPEKPKPVKPARHEATAPASQQKTPASQQNASGKPAPAISRNAGTGYFLQSGAYKNSSGAEQQRARLGLQGFESKIMRSDVNGTTYYRVRLGPFARQEDMNAARQHLAGVGIDTTIIKDAKAGQQ